MNAPGTSPVVVCPATPERTRQVCIDRWGTPPPGYSDNFATQRHQTMNDLRIRGDAAGAERFGWLSLAALWAGHGANTALAVGADRRVDVSATMLAAIAGDLDRDPAPAARVPGTALTATDPRDRAALVAADLAAAAAGSAVVDVAGSPIAAAAVTSALAAALDKETP